VATRLAKVIGQHGGHARNQQHVIDARDGHVWSQSSHGASQSFPWDEGRDDPITASLGEVGLQHGNVWICAPCTRYRILEYVELAHASSSIS
jgi:hypothetical protein